MLGITNVTAIIPFAYHLERIFVAFVPFFAEFPIFVQAFLAFQILFQRLCVALHILTLEFFVILL